MPIAELSPEEDKIYLETLYREKDLVKQIPGSSWNPKRSVWTVPLSWGSCVILRGVFQDQLEIGPRLGAWAKNEVDTRVAPANALREAVDFSGSPQLFGYQRAGVEFLSIAERAMLCDGLGAGKTRVALMTAMKLYEKGYNPFPMLVVAPNSTKTGWKREAATVWPGLTVAIVKGSAAQRRKQLEEPAHVYIMNWEQLRGHSRLAGYGSIGLKRCKDHGGEDERIDWKKCEVHPRELNQIEFNMVVADECHRSKDAHSKQTRALWAATGDAPFRYALTGTPIADAPDDLWTILHWLEPKEWPTRSKFIDRFCQIQYNAFGAPIVTGLKPETKDEFFRIVNPRMRRMPKELVLKHLPPTMYERRDVEMTPKQKKAYEAMRDKLVVDLDGDILTASSPLTKMTRLIQFSSSYAEIQIEQKRKRNSEEMEDVEVVRLIEPSCKIDAFVNDMPDFGDDSVVVFAVSRQLIDLLSAKLSKMDVPHGLITGAQSTEERQHAIDDFQAGRTKYILATVGAGGVGLTLTAARIAVFLQRSWSNIENTQAEGRVHRIGSEIHDSVLYIDYVTTGSVEEAQHQAVAAKGERLEEILRDKDLLKRALLDGPVMDSLKTQVHDKDHNDGSTEGSA